MTVMTSYQSRNQIRTELQRMLPYQIEECREGDELPSTLHDLIKHNFQASFVCYDKKKNTIEIGVKEQENEDSYPTITVHTIGLDEAVSKLTKSFKSTDLDLKFYGKLLAGGYVNRIDDVVLV